MYHNARSHECQIHKIAIEDFACQSTWKNTVMCTNSEYVFVHVTPKFSYSKAKLIWLTLRLLMSYIYIYIYEAPILDVSRSHTTTQHSR